MIKEREATIEALLKEKARTEEAEGEVDNGRGLDTAVSVVTISSDDSHDDSEPQIESPQMYH